MTGSDQGKTVKTVFTRFSLVDLTTLVGDKFRIFVQPQFERLDEDFNVFGDVVVPVGTYDFVSTGFALEASRSRQLSGSLEFSGGEFYNGVRWNAISRLRWQPNPRFLFELSYNHTQVWLDRAYSTLCDEDEQVAVRCGNTFTVRVATARGAIQFSPDLSWNLLVQYENDTNEMSMETRLRWTIQPGNDLFLIFRQSFLAEDHRLKAARTEPLVKLAWTFRL